MMMMTTTICCLIRATVTMWGWSEGAIDECSNGGMMISREKYRNSQKTPLVTFSSPYN